MPTPAITKQCSTVDSVGSGLRAQLVQDVRVRHGEAGDVGEVVDEGAQAGGSARGGGRGPEGQVEGEPDRVGQRECLFFF